MLILLITKLAYFIVKLLGFTYRIRVVGQDHVDNLILKGPYLKGFWHEDLILSINADKYISRVVGMVSLSKDGNIAATFAKNWGIESVRGSSSRNGKNAMNEMIQKIKEEGKIGGITVDGPRGPRHKVKKGIVEISRVTGAPIICLGCYADRFWELKSWDKFKIPKPFSRIVMTYQPPIVIPYEATYQEIIEFTQIVEKNLEEAHQNSRKLIKENS